MLISPPTARRTTPSRSVTMAALTAAGLSSAFAAFQVALTAGAPLGQHVWGGRSETAVLPADLRVGSALAAIILIWIAAVVLARAELTTLKPVPTRWLTLTTWLIGGYMALNTLANLASVSALERYGFSAISATIATTTIVVARHRLSRRGRSTSRSDLSSPTR